MGTTGALGFAEAVKDGDVTLEQAIAWNLSANHFPPLPSAYVAPVVEAISLANDGDWNADVILPKDIQPVPVLARWDEDADGFAVEAATLLEITHSWHFTDQGV